MVLMLLWRWIRSRSLSLVVVVPLVLLPLCALHLPRTFDCLVSSPPALSSCYFWYVATAVATAVAAADADAARAAWRRAEGRWAVVFRWCLLLLLSVPARGGDGRFLVWLFCCGCRRVGVACDDVVVGLAGLALCRCCCWWRRRRRTGRCLECLCFDTGFQNPRVCASNDVVLWPRHHCFYQSVGSDRCANVV